MKFLKVDMTTQIISYQDVPQEYAGLGGRGLTSIMINHEVPPDCDPLGPDNKLIFAPGLLTGTNLVNTSRISIGAKSPLTGGIKESNVGGAFPAALGRLGIGAVIVEGQAPQGELYLLRIDQEGQAELVPADEYKKLRTYALAEKLFQTYGDRNGILCVGPAGEHRLACASIQSTDVDKRPCRAAGRGGIGAVMGAKGLKALVAAQGGKAKTEATESVSFKESAKLIAKAIQDDSFSGDTLPKMGTAALVDTINNAGAFPCYNATKGVFEGWEKISGEALVETIKDRGGQIGHRGCSQCVIRCSNVFLSRAGEYVTSSLEYETIWAVGGMCGIDDLDTIARLDFLWGWPSAWQWMPDTAVSVTDRRPWDFSKRSPRAPKWAGSSATARSAWGSTSITTGFRWPRSKASPPTTRGLSRAWP